MALRFNPPPGWEVPDEGFVPPPGWAPDPSWPPAPSDWRFWTTDETPTPAESTSGPEVTTTAPQVPAAGPIWTVPPVHGAAPTPLGVEPVTPTPPPSGATPVPTAPIPVGPAAVWAGNPYAPPPAGVAPTAQFPAASAPYPPVAPPYGTAPGYPPAYGGYYAPGTAPSTNGLAIASLVLGILGLFVIPAPIGLILGIIALTQVRRAARESRPQKGKGLAIGGIATSSAFIALWTVAIIASLLASTEVVGPVSSPRSVSPAAMGVGLCFQQPANRNRVYGVSAVPCSTPHSAQVFARIAVDGPSRPSTSRLDNIAETDCDSRAQSALSTTKVPDDWDPSYYYVPDDADWDDGYRAVVCIIAGDSTKLSSSVLSDNSDT